MNQQFIVVVAGAVAWSNTDSIRTQLEQLPKHTLIVHGDSPGADALAGEVARALQLKVHAMQKSKGDYAKYGRGAWKGLNERMLAMGASRVLVFHPNIEASRGSKHLAELARDVDIEVLVFAE